MIEFYFLPSYRFPEAAEASAYLGSVIKHYDDIESGYIPDDGDFSVYFKDPIKFRDYEVFDVQARAMAKKSRTNSAGFSDAINAGVTTTRGAGVTFSAKRLCYRRLQHESELLDAYLRSETFRARAAKWIKRKQGHTACMVVGLLMCDDLILSDVEQSSDNVHIKGSVPILSATTAALTALPISLPDPSFNFGRGVSVDSRFEGSHRGAKIVGLEYRWIRRAMLSSEISIDRTGPSSKYHLAESDDGDEESTSENEDENGAAMSLSSERDVVFDEGSWIDDIVQQNR